MKKPWPQTPEEWAADSAEVDAEIQSDIEDYSPTPEFAARLRKMLDTPMEELDEGELRMFFQFFRYSMGRGAAQYRLKFDVVETDDPRVWGINATGN